MAAGVIITETNTGSVITDIITNINYGSDDSFNIVIATNPINRGNFSFEKFNRLKLSNLSGSSQIDTFIVWLSGTEDTGIVHDTNLTGSILDEAYHTPIETVSSEAIRVAPTAPPSLPNFGKSGANTAMDTNGQYSDYHISQAETQGGASPGDQTTLNWYYQYDEQ